MYVNQLDILLMYVNDLLGQEAQCQMKRAVAQKDYVFSL